MNHISELNPKIHTLKNGSTVSWISHHGFKFSDGTQTDGAQVPEVVDLFNLTKQVREMHTINGMRVVSIAMVTTEEQQTRLQQLSDLVDIIIVPFPVLVALREQGIRHLFPKCMAFNCTKDTQRLAPSEKIVDINQWSW